MSNIQAERREDTNRMATLANLAMFGREGTEKYIERAPHLKHPRLRQLYAELVRRIFNEAKQYAEVPTVLDLGAGEGSAMLPFLELGGRVTAVDISESQLATLVAKCRQFGDRLEVRQEEISQILRRKEVTYDVVVMNSFLHHIPDYLSVIREAISVLRPHGQFFSFQDPLRYDTLGRGTWFFSNLSYFWWRIFQGNYVQGLKTRIRRIRGIYVAGSKEDDAEYHVTRNGVDQNAIASLLQSEGFTSSVVRYFSTQSRAFQVLGAFLGVENTFAMIAQRIK